MMRFLCLACLILSSALGVSASTSDPAAAAAVAQVSPPAELSEPVTPVAAPVAATVKSNDIPKKVAVLVSMALAFNSGYSNGVCLGTGIGGANQAVAAVTGAWTTSAYNMAKGNTAPAFVQIKALLSYMGGSAIAGCMIPNPTAFKLSETTGQTFLIGAGLMLAASQLAEKAGAGATNKLCFYLALMANGLQNSVTSVHTANLCRSAHFSGITSDMGTFMGQCLRGNKENLFKLKVFALLALSFWGGGFSSFFVTQKFDNGSGLYASAALYLAIGLHLVMRKGLW